MIVWHIEHKSVQQLKSTSELIYKNTIYQLKTYHLERIRIDMLSKVVILLIIIFSGLAVYLVVPTGFETRVLLTIFILGIEIIFFIVLFLVAGLFLTKDKICLL